MNNNTGSSYVPSTQESKPDRVHTQPIAHSTHAFCETFDQATRDIQQESKSNSAGAGTGEVMAASTGGHRRHSGAAKEENEESLREANSAVQLDRDVQKSRRGTDDAKQGSSSRDGSWVTNPNELPYIE
ncbi:hypothetical protein EC957_007318 [Mortierella hygrophila]|uniref:Uncharacterized protein n=1 Tax=Mortierella hygrophila TaxID=979708 RepID=A0A9P6FD59_9FUNG|nr:hypothetical protein EC957_007318 [Mortierella hygrophila]